MSVVGHVQHRTDGLLRLGQGTGLKLDLCSRALCQTGLQKASPAGAAVGCLPHECDLEVSGLVFCCGLVWFGGEGYRYTQACLFPLSVPHQLTGKHWLRCELPADRERCFQPGAQIRDFHPVVMQSPRDHPCCKIATGNRLCLKGCKK